MKVRILTSRAGQGWAEYEGDIVDYPHEEAAQLIRSGQAEVVNSEVELEMAVEGDVRTAALTLKHQRKLRRP